MTATTTSSKPPRRRLFTPPPPPGDDDDDAKENIIIIFKGERDFVKKRDKNGLDSKDDYDLFRVLEKGVLRIHTTLSLVKTSSSPSLSFSLSGSLHKLRWILGVLA